MTGREDVERAILEHESILEEVARLLENGTPLSTWSEDVRLSLALALADPAMSRTESWKSVALRRHLFGPAGVVPGMIAATHRDPSALDRARAERLRAGIPARVAYRAGMYLLQPGA